MSARRILSGGSRGESASCRFQPPDAPVPHAPPPPAGPAASPPPPDGVSLVPDPALPPPPSLFGCQRHTRSPDAAPGSRPPHHVRQHPQGLWTGTGRSLVLSFSGSQRLRGIGVQGPECGDVRYPERRRASALSQAPPLASGRQHGLPHPERGAVHRGQACSRGAGRAAQSV